MKIGETIRRLRKDKKLTQVQLASLVGLQDHTQISKLETGKAHQLTADQVVRFASALETSIESLMEEEESSVPFERKFMEVARRLNPARRKKLLRYAFDLENPDSDD